MQTRLRRFAALLVAALALQLALLGAGGACAMPEGAAAGADVAAAHDGHHEHDGRDGGDAAHPAHHDGAAPCPAAAACATAVAAEAPATVPDAVRLLAAAIELPVAELPTSRVGAPEPPPPRA